MSSDVVNACWHAARYQGGEMPRFAAVGCHRVEYTRVIEYEEGSHVMP